jgi:hypothetical protein
MYVYIYDSFIGEGKYDKLLYKIEKRLTDLGLNGKIIRLGIGKNLEATIDDEIRLGAKTIVAVGNDSTTAQVVNAVAGNDNDKKGSICLGIIPLEEKNSRLAKIFGINNANSACEILLGRRVETLSLFSINNNFFLFGAKAELSGATIEIDKNFIIQPTKPSKLEVKVSPEKNKDLFLTIEDKEQKSFFNFKEMILVNKESPIITDGAIEIKTPVKIFPGNEKIKIIVGKNRQI